MAEINYPTGERYATSVLRVRGPGPLASVDEVLQSVAPVDRVAPWEHWAPQGLRIYSRFLDVGPVTGQYSYAVLWNPIQAAVAGGPPAAQASDTLLCVDWVNVAPATIFALGEFAPAWWLTWGGLVGTITGQPHDVRYRAPSSAMLAWGNDTQPTLGAHTSVLLQGLGLVGTSYETRPLRLVLPPGWGIYARSLGTGSSLITTWEWVERSP